MKLNYFLFGYILLFSLQLSSQETINEQLHFNLPASRISGVHVTDSCYYVTGVAIDSVAPYYQVALFSKLNLDGTINFSKMLKLPEAHTGIWDNSIQSIGDHSFVVTSLITDSVLKASAIQINDVGDTLSVTKLSNFVDEALFILPRALLYDDGNFLLAIQEVESSDLEDGDIVLTYLSSSGSVIWRKRYNTDQFNQRPLSIVKSLDGNFIIGAVVDNTFITDVGFRSQNYLLAVDSSGQFKWHYFSPLDTLMDGANSMCLAPDGGLIIATGYGEEIRLQDWQSGLDWRSGLIYKLSMDRQVEWQREFTEPTTSYHTKFSKVIAASDSSGYVAAGNYFKYGEELSVDSYGWLVKVSPAGDSLWSRSYRFFPTDGGLYVHSIFDVKEHPDGGFILVGETFDYNAPMQAQQGWLLRVDQDGCLVPNCGLVATEDLASNQQSQLSLYPNPVRDNLSIFLRYHNVPSSSRAILQVVDLNGSIVKSWSVDAHSEVTHIYSVADLAAGAYFVRHIIDGKLSAVESFIKK